MENSEEILENLLEKYWAGLKMPLHFFPRSSWEYAYLFLEKDTPPERALQRAHTIWRGNDYLQGECEDAYYRLCFRNTDPLDAEFQESAEEIFGPLLEQQRETD